MSETPYFDRFARIEHLVRHAQSYVQPALHRLAINIQDINNLLDEEDVIEVLYTEADGDRAYATVRTVDHIGVLHWLVSTNRLPGFLGDEMDAIPQDGHLVIDVGPDRDPWQVAFALSVFSDAWVMYCLSPSFEVVEVQGQQVLVRADDPIQELRARMRRDGYGLVTSLANQQEFRLSDTCMPIEINIMVLPLVIPDE